MGSLGGELSECSQKSAVNEGTSKTASAGSSKTETGCRFLKGHVQTRVHNVASRLDGRRARVSPCSRIGRSGIIFAELCSTQSCCAPGCNFQRRVCTRSSCSALSHHKASIRTAGAIALLCFFCLHHRSVKDTARPRRAARAVCHCRFVADSGRRRPGAANHRLVRAGTSGAAHVSVWLTIFKLSSLLVLAALLLLFLLRANFIGCHLPVCCLGCPQRLVAMNAARKSADAASSVPLSLRLLVDAGGCSGFQYKLTIENAAATSSDMCVLHARTPINPSLANIFPHPRRGYNISPHTHHALLILIAFSKPCMLILPTSLCFCHRRQRFRARRRAPAGRRPVL